MSSWIPVSERLPEANHKKYSNWRESETVPIKVKGYAGWQTGAYIVSDNDAWWRIHGWNGEYKVTHWFDLPPQPESEDN